jgi:hypothetical protein
VATGDGDGRATSRVVMETVLRAALALIAAVAWCLVAALLVAG